VKYTVRNKDGEVAFESRAELQNAARTGLVEADDEVKSEGDANWKRAASITWLTTDTAKKPGPINNPFFRWMLLSSLGAIAAFWLIYRGRSEKSYEMQAAGVGIVVVVAIILMRVTTNAQRRR